MGCFVKAIYRNTEGKISNNVVTRKLVEHLNQIDAEARDREEQLVKQMMEKQGITEKLKRQDNMEWTRRMNTICHDAEEMILTEMIYTKG